MRALASRLGLPAAFALALALLAGCGGGASSPAAAPGGSHGEAPLGAPAGVPASDSPAFDDQTWNVGDCVNGGDPDMRIDYYKVTCGTSGAEWRIVAKNDDVNTIGDLCRKNPDMQKAFARPGPGNAQILAGDTGGFCLVSTDLGRTA